MIVEVTVGDRTYKLSPIRTGQMRAMGEARLKNPNQSYMQDNVQMLVYCLKNADPLSEFTFENIDDMDFPIYKALLDKAQEISGFLQATPGEAAAAQSIN